MPPSSATPRDAAMQALQGLMATHPEIMTFDAEAPGSASGLIEKAGDAALQGSIPVVTGWSESLSSGANEAIYLQQARLSAAGKGKIIYLAHGAGLVPGNDLATEAVRDIGLVRTIPEVGICEPCTAKETEDLLRFAVEHDPRSVYMRLADATGSRPITLPDEYTAGLGNGCIIREGTHVAFISAGPIMLAQALEAAELLEAEQHLEPKVINLPWHSDIDAVWLSDALNDVKFAIVIDNQVMRGAQSEELRRIFKYDARFSGVVGRHISTDGFPKSGEAAEVLARAGLDARSIADQVMELIDG